MDDDAPVLKLKRPLPRCVSSDDEPVAKLQRRRQDAGTSCPESITCAPDASQQEHVVISTSANEHHVRALDLRLASGQSLDIDTTDITEIGLLRQRIGKVLGVAEHRVALISSSAVEATSIDALRAGLVTVVVRSSLPPGDGKCKGKGKVKKFGPPGWTETQYEEEMARLFRLHGRTPQLRLALDALIPEDPAINLVRMGA